MSDVISVRVPKELKEKMKKYRIDWSREVRRFLEDRIKVLEFLETLDNIEKKAENRRTKVDSAELIRESREKR
ncbi:MAG: CopG family transcriptional regulator [Desulfurococcales archaeon]|nr:CopG family transcriptional regulator [Desulfurococcales archaeon]